MDLFNNCFEDLRLGSDGGQRQQTAWDSTFGVSSWTEVGPVCSLCTDLVEAGALDTFPETFWDPQCPFQR